MATTTRKVLGEELFQMSRLYWKSAVLLAGLRLEVFDLLRDTQSASAVGSARGADAAAMELLLNSLVALQILEKESDGYRNTTFANAFLTESSPMSMKLVWLHLADQWGAWGHLHHAVLRGEPTAMRWFEEATRQGGSDLPEAHPDEHYVPCSTQISKLLAEEFVRKVDLTGVKRVLDVGGGAAGNYSHTICRKLPDATADILDLPGTAEKAQQRAEAAGLGGRIRGIPGDARENDYGSGYDLAIMSLFIHVFPAEIWQLIIRKAFKALAPSGRLAIMEYILDDDRVGPEFSTLYALYCLVNFKGGYAATLGEVEKWMYDAGFARVEHLDIYRGLIGVIGVKADEAV